jgi:hypothetical protein
LGCFTPTICLSSWHTANACGLAHFTMNCSVPNQGKDGEFRWVKNQTKRGRDRDGGPVSVSRAWLGNPKAAMLPDDGEPPGEFEWTGEPG